MWKAKPQSISKKILKLITEIKTLITTFKDLYTTCRGSWIPSEEGWGTSREGSSSYISENQISWVNVYNYTKSL